MERFVNVPVARDTPPAVLAACREVVPTAELVHVGGNRWWLGYVKASPAMDIGYDAPAGDKYQHALQRQGFRWLGEYEDKHICAGFLRRELEFMFTRTSDELEMDYLSTEDHASGAHEEFEKAETLRRKAEADGREIYRKVFRRRRAFAMAGLTLSNPHYLPS